MSDEQLTILDRLVQRAGIAEERARSYLSGGWIRAGGEVVREPEQVVVGSFVIVPPAVTEFVHSSPDRGPA